MGRARLGYTEWLCALTSPHPHPIPLQGGAFELGDRVISALNSSTPPFGLPGTVVGKLRCVGGKVLESC